MQEVTRPTVAVTVAVYNEGERLRGLLEGIQQQTLAPEEIIVVDDGSTDDTPRIVASFAASDPRVRYVRQENAGPAAARNRAWRAATADICAFTDGDCVPDADWLQRLTAPFAEKCVGAVGGTYRTLNTESVLAEFIGLEIAWRYRTVRGNVDCHGTYNLAVRRCVLEEVGGLDASYRHPSGEDWDMTYRISRRYEIRYVPEAVVGHYHPDDIAWYMRNQVRRAFDRVRLYADHPDKLGADSYTAWHEKYQVLATAMCVGTLPLVAVPVLGALPMGLGAVALGGAVLPVPWMAKHSVRAAAVGPPIRLARNLAWALGLSTGAASIALPWAKRVLDHASR